MNSSGSSGRFSGASLVQTVLSWKFWTPKMALALLGSPVTPYSARSMVCSWLSGMKQKSSEEVTRMRPVASRSSTVQL